MRVHFIAIGGSAMHNLAIALHQKGYEVSGSDDEIFEPSRSRLEARGILPSQTGWFPEKITADLDAVILGMHARADNPELLRAKELNLKIYSYPEYIYNQTSEKTRIVIGGSHGKTSITAIILHVTKAVGLDVDFMVGAQLEGFDCMVKLSETASFAILEGDEYLSSPVDRRPKFHLYKPNIALLSGIAWDHINVFPTFENYVSQFSQFINLIESDGHLIYNSEDETLKKLASQARSDIQTHSYNIHPHIIRNGITFLKANGEEIPLQIFGDHNLMNLNGARLVCGIMGIDSNSFYRAVSDFKGASKRLELVARKDDRAFYKDFAHSPSKLKATISAVKKQFPERKLMACMELHTFSSLNREFLEEYKGSMNEADVAVVYYNHHTISHKKLPDLSPEDVKKAFQSPEVVVINESEKLKEFLRSQSWPGTNLLMMSSGNFDGVDFKILAEDLGFIS